MGSKQRSDVVQVTQLIASSPGNVLAYYKSLNLLVILIAIIALWFILDICYRGRFFSDIQLSFRYNFFYMFKNNASVLQKLNFGQRKIVLIFFYLKLSE
jgi:hypothetical protein